MPSELRTGDIAAGFRIMSLVGQGAVGSVYLAEDVRNGNRVALKVLGDELAGDERFGSASCASRSWRPASTIPTSCPRSPPARRRTVASTCDGVHRRLRPSRSAPDKGTLEPQRALDLVGQVGEALDAAHETGLVHRDVKPGNVLVTERADGEHAYVCDFGLARHVSSVSSLTGDRGFVGTIDYVPPEQIPAARSTGARTSTRSAASFSSASPAPGPSSATASCPSCSPI